MPGPASQGRRYLAQERRPRFARPAPSHREKLNLKTPKNFIKNILINNAVAYFIFCFITTIFPICAISEAFFAEQSSAKKRKEIGGLFIRSKLKMLQYKYKKSSV
jgi:hypothetical protein